MKYPRELINRARQSAFVRLSLRLILYLVDMRKHGWRLLLSVRIIPHLTSSSASLG